MTTPIKTPTSWRPGSGLGSVALVGNLPIVDTVLFLPIVDTVLKLPIATNTTLTLPKNPTIWTQTG